MQPGTPQGGASGAGALAAEPCTSGSANSGPSPKATRRIASPPSAATVTASSEGPADVASASRRAGGASGGASQSETATLPLVPLRIPAGVANLGGGVVLRLSR